MQKKYKIPIKNVQKAFSAAIRRRDCRCMIKDYEPCSGELECSHFFTQGANPSLMFYPLNAYAQCRRHHWNHHNKKDCIDVYRTWLENNRRDELEKMSLLRTRFIRYTDDLKREIIKLCDENRLNELESLIEKELGYV